MWFFTSLRTRLSAKKESANSSDALPSKDYETLSKRITDVHATALELKSELHVMDARLSKLQGTLYAKLYPSRKEDQVPDKKPEQTESEDLNPIKPPFW